MARRLDEYDFAIEDNWDQPVQGDTGSQAGDFGLDFGWERPADVHQAVPEPPAYTPPQVDAQKSYEPPKPAQPDWQAKYGFSPDASQMASFNAGRASLEELERDMARRAAPTSHRSFDSQSDYYDTKTGYLTDSGIAELQASGRSPDPREMDPSKRINRASSALKDVFGSSSSTDGGSGGQNQPDLMAQLRSMFPNGAFNQGVVDRRTDNVRDVLNRQRRSQTATNQAQLANRGLMDSGPEITAANSLDTRLGDIFAGAYSNIYADESSAADKRMMDALQIAAGMTMEEARLAVDQFRAQTDRDLGFGQLDLGRDKLGLDRELGTGQLGLERLLGTGNLALGNLSAVNDYNLNMGRLGLDRDRLLNEIENGDIDRLIELINQMYQGANLSAGGYY